MTSQKSLKNNVNFNDFKRSFKENIWLPMVAFVVLFVWVTFPVIEYVTDKEFVLTPIHNELQVFIEHTSIGMTAFCTGMVFCGVLTALKCFYFLFSKKQVNVYLSLGVTRTTMFINRIVSAVGLLFVATLIPTLIVFILNITNFGITAHMTKTFLYMFFGLFISGLVGFAITTMAMMISGNIFEAALTTISMVFIPMVLATAVDFLRMNLLKGYFNDGNVSGVWLHLFSPFTFVNDCARELNGKKEFADYTNINELLDVLFKNDLVNGKIPANLTVDFGLALPLIIWLVVSVLLMLGGFLLINKRKAEHANSVGHFNISRAINATFAVCVVVELFATGTTPVDFSIGTILLIIATTFVAYFVAQLILARKFKKAVKSLGVWAILACITVTGFVAFDTGFFGAYNKTPEISNVKSASISFGEMPLLYNAVRSDGGYVKSVNEKDTKMIIELFDEIKNDKKTDDWQGWVTFAFEDENGEIKRRQFTVYSTDLYEKYIKTVFESSYFDAIAEYRLLGFNNKNLSVNGKYEIQNPEEYVENPYSANLAIPDSIEPADDTYITRGYYYDNQMLVTSSWEGKLDDNVIEDFSILIQKGDALAKAFYNDITKMTYEDVFKSKVKPIGVIGLSVEQVFNGNTVLKPSLNEWEKYQIQSVTTEYENEKLVYYINGKRVGSDLSNVTGNFTVISRLLVYPQMTETVKWLNDNDVEFKHQYKGKIKEVLYTNSPLDCSDACSYYEDKYENRFSDYYTLSREKMFESSQFYYSSLIGLSDCITKEETCYNLLKAIYKEAGQPLLALDSDKYSEVLNKCVPFYYVNNDNGRYVYVVYEDGSVVQHYLPEASVGVLK